MVASTDYYFSDSFGRIDNTNSRLGIGTVHLCYFLAPVHSSRQNERKSFFVGEAQVLYHVCQLSRKLSGSASDLNYEFILDSETIRRWWTG